MKPTRKDRRTAETAGRRAETIAALILRLKGYSVVAIRFKSHGGEIDIIAKRGAVLCFIEVKRRTSISAALEAVTMRNRRRISNAAAAFLAKHPNFAMNDMRYDIFAFAGWRWRHIKGAWIDGD